MFQIKIANYTAAFWAIHAPFVDDHYMKLYNTACNQEDRARCFLGNAKEAEGRRTYLFLVLDRITKLCSNYRTLIL